MNILYITYDGISEPVAESQVLPYLKRLSGDGIKITLLSFEKAKRINDRGDLRDYGKVLAKHNIEWVPRRYHKHPAVPATVFDIIKGTLSGISLIKKKKIDTVHARGYIPALIGCMLKSIFKTKLIFDMRGFWPDEKVDAGAWKEGSLLHSLFKRLEDILLRRSDEVVVLTESAKEEVMKRHPEKSGITAIPCGVDLAQFRQKTNPEECPDDPPAGRFIVLYTGNLGSFYDTEGIFSFFRFIKGKKKEAFLRIISNYPKNLIDEKAYAFHIDASDYRLDMLEHACMPKAFSCAHISLVFYRRRLSARGCSPIKLSESLASGVPVVVNSNVGDSESIVESNKVGVVMRDSSENELERALGRIEALLGEHDAVKARCRAVAERLFSLDAAVDKYRNIYRRLEFRV